MIPCIVRFFKIGPYTMGFPNVVSNLTAISTFRGVKVISYAYPKRDQGEDVEASSIAIMLLQVYAYKAYDALVYLFNNFNQQTRKYALQHMYNLNLLIFLCLGSFKFDSLKSYAMRTYA